MSAKRTGVTNDTVKNLILDAGVIYANYDEEGERLIGATEGGNTFTVEREVRDIPVDGVKGKWKGGRRIITENAQLGVNIKEWSKENFLLALSGSTATDHPETDSTHDEIRSSGEISDDDYLTNVAYVGRVSGSDEPVVIILENALADGNFELNSEDQQEGVVEVQISAHYDPEDIDTVPYAIRYPKMTE